MKQSGIFLHFFQRTTLLAFLVTVIFSVVGCSNIHEDAYVYEKKEYVYISLNLNASFFGAEVSSSIGTRTILPDTIDLTNTTKYNFYIWGKSQKGSISPRKVVFDSTTLTTGTIELDFPIATYAFVLAVVEGEPSDVSSGSQILENAVLVGYTNADLTYTNTVKFSLLPNEISGYGDVKLSLLLDNSWTDFDVTELNALTDGSYDYSVTADLYDISNGELVYSNTATDIYGLNKSTPVIFSHAHVTSGTYNFTVKFKKIGSSIIYNYSDRIVIYSNQTCDTQVLIPNVVEKVPVAPSDFKAAYCNDSPLYEGTLGDEASYSNYGLLLKWVDNSNNESHFKITLANVAKTTTALSDIPAPEVFTDSDWNTIVGPYAGNSKVVKVYDDTYTRSTEYFAGSPEKNNTKLVLLIPFDGCYIAKIEAVNDAGLSSACYATINEDFTLQIAEDIFNTYNSYAELNGHAFRTTENTSCNVINLYHIVYYLCGGEYSYIKNTTPTKLPIIDYAVYGTQMMIRCPSYRESEASVATPSLIYDNSRWNAWTKNYYGGDLLEGESDTTKEGHPYQKPNDYTGYTSLYLFARYN